MFFFETEKKIRKVIFDRKANEAKSYYIEENADPEKVVAETLELLRIEIEKRKNARNFFEQK